MTVYDFFDKHFFEVGLVIVLIILAWKEAL